jgi:hypothetical protein
VNPEELSFTTSTGGGFSELRCSLLRELAPKPDVDLDGWTIDHEGTDE